KIKFESTRQAQRVAKLRMEIRREHDAIAALRAEWAKLDNPGRIQDLVRRHLPLKPVEGRQFDTLDNLPERPPDAAPVEQSDSIGPLIAGPEAPARSPTGSLPAPKRCPRWTPPQQIGQSPRANPGAVASWTRCSTGATSTAPPRRGHGSASP